MSKQGTNMKILSPNGETKFCFLFGKELGFSLSPIIQTDWFLNYKLNTIYLPCQILEEKDFKKLIKSLFKTPSFLGANITMPFKSTILKAFSENKIRKFSNAVTQTGSANTLYKDINGQWKLENTDIFGIQKTFESLIPRKRKYNLFLFGGGGAASSCLYYARNIDTYCEKIICLTRNPEKSKTNHPIWNKLEKFEYIEYQEDLNQIGKGYFNSFEFDKSILQVIVNTIPHSPKQKMDGNNMISQMERVIPKSKIVFFDMVYKESMEQIYCQGHDIAFKNGEIMLLEQAKQSFYLWTGIMPE